MSDLSIFYLSIFCGTDRTRYGLLEPWAENGFARANYKVLSRAKGVRHASPSTPS